MSSHTSLEAATQDRKARLAQLKSLKRKQPSDTYSDPPSSIPQDSTSTAPTTTSAEDVTAIYLSGRNYDASTRGPKLGFEYSPAGNQITLEEQAANLALETKKQAEEEEKEDKPLDLFKLQPKKPNWDLKRDLEQKLEVLNVRTDNAIARLVRERIQGQKKAQGKGVAGGDGENVGVEGVVLVEAMNVREREEREEERREREDDEM